MSSGKYSKLMVRENVQVLVQRYSKRYCPVHIPGGIFPHAYRHAVATDILKNDTSKVEVAAAALHDTAETVRRNYAHLLVADRHSHYQDYLDTILPMAT
jgi:integrase